MAFRLLVPSPTIVIIMPFGRRSAFGWQRLRLAADAWLRRRLLRRRCQLSLVPEVCPRNLGRTEGGLKNKMAASPPLDQADITEWQTEKKISS
jgi:hypothetical protein